MNKISLMNKGYIVQNLLNDKQVEIIKKKISFYYNLKKNNINSKISSLYLKNSDKAGNRYDLLNLDLDIQAIFYSDNVIKKIKKIFSDKISTKKLHLGFADFQILVMLPNTKKEHLGWHQDSAYFRYSNKLSSNLVVWTPISMTSKIVNGSLDLIEKSNKKGPIKHDENLSKIRKKVSLNQRGRFFIDEKKINMKNKINISVESGKSLIFDANMIHRTSREQKISNDIRFTLIARYKYLNKLMIK